MWRKISWNTWLWNCAAQIGTWIPGLLAETTHLILRFHHHFWVMQLCRTLCDPMDCSTPGFPFLQHHLEYAQTNVHWVGDVTQPSHPLLPPSLPALNLSQHQVLFQWVISSYQMAKVLEFSNFRGKNTQTFWSVRIYYTILCCIMFSYSLNSYISVDSRWNWEGESKLIFHPKVCSFVSLSTWMLWEVPCQRVNRKKERYC